jgi:hypothetical protein
MGKLYENIQIIKSRRKLPMVHAGECQGDLLKRSKFNLSQQNGLRAPLDTHRKIVVDIYLHFSFLFVEEEDQKRR